MIGRLVSAIGLVMLMAGCATEATTDRSAERTSPKTDKDRAAVFDTRKAVEPLNIHGDGYYEVYEDGVTLRLDSLVVTHDPSLRGPVNATAVVFRLQRERWVRNWVPHRWSEPLAISKTFGSVGDQLVLSDMVFEVFANLAHGKRYRIDVVLLDGNAVVGAAYGPWFYGIRLKPAGKLRTAAAS